MIENRFGLPPLSVRDANANDIGDELDFTAGTLAAPDFDVPFMPLSPPCAIG